MAADGHLGMMALWRVTLASAGLSCLQGGGHNGAIGTCVSLHRYDTIRYGKFHPEILSGSSRTGASNKGGVGKTSYFLCVNISKMVGDVQS